MAQRYSSTAITILLFVLLLALLLLGTPFRMMSNVRFMFMFWSWFLSIFLLCRNKGQSKKKCSVVSAAPQGQYGSSITCIWWRCEDRSLHNIRSLDIIIWNFRGPRICCLLDIVINVVPKPGHVREEWFTKNAHAWTKCGDVVLIPKIITCSLVYGSRKMIG